MILEIHLLHALYVVVIDAAPFTMNIPHQYNTAHAAKVRELCLTGISMSVIYGSATGANVIYGKNNTGVAFGGGGAVASCVDSDGWTLDKNNAIPESINNGPAPNVDKPAYGMQVTADEDFDGVTLVTFKCRVHRLGSPTGNLEARLYATLGGTLTQTSSSVFDVSTLDTAVNELEYTFTSTTLATNNVIVLYIVGGSSDTDNCVQWAGVYPPVDREYKVAKLQEGNWTNGDSYTLTFSICPT